MDPDLVRVMAAIGACCLLGLAALYRPLLYCSVAPETAAARGVPVKLVGLLFMTVMAIGVAEAAQVVGVLLSTALAVVLAMALGVAETWLGIVLGYDSYYWPPGEKGWPASFFITVLALVGYLLARWANPAGRRRLTASVAVLEAAA